MKTGSIPKNIRVFARPPIEIKFKWDDIDVADDVAVNVCQPIFVTDSTNKKTQATAKAWAGQESWKWDPKTGERVYESEAFAEFERTNEPMTVLRIIGLTFRGNGGRAYQVLIGEKYVFDLREDVLLDAMLNDGMGKNGTLFGSYIFASVGSEMKLIRVGSLLHAKMIETTVYKTKKKITKLEIGGIYTNATATVLYLGEVYTRTLTYERGGGYWGRRGEPTRIQLEDERKMFLTVDLGEKIPDKISDLKERCYLNMNWLKSKPTSFRDKIGHLDVSAENRQEALDIFVKNAESYLAQGGRRDEAEYVACYSDALNVSTTPGFIHPLVTAAVSKIS